MTSACLSRIWWARSIAAGIARSFFWPTNGPTSRRVGTSKARLRRLRELAQAVPVGDGTMWESETFRHKVYAVETELKALEMTQLRVIAAEQNNGGMPNPASSILKIKGLGNPAAHDGAGAGAGGAGSRCPIMMRTMNRKRARMICPMVSVGRIRRRRRISIIAR